MTSLSFRVSTTTSGRWPTGGSSSTGWAQQTGQRSRSTTSSATLPTAGFTGPATFRHKLATWTPPSDGGSRPSITGSAIRLSQSVPARSSSRPANGRERKPSGAGDAVGDAILMQENDSGGETAPELAVLLRPAAANSSSAASA